MKNKKTITIIILVLIIALTSIIIYTRYNDKDKKVVSSQKEEYEATINAYGESVTLAINNYIKNKNGSIPKWEDIENNILTLKDKVTCNTHINYDGTIYLSECTVEGITYTSNYTYGKKLISQKNTYKEIYVYSSSFDNINPQNIYYVVTTQKYENNTYGDIYTLIDTYKCQEENCKGYYSSTPNINKTIIYDDKYYMYNYKTHEKEEINLGNEEYQSVNLIASKEKIYALSVKNYQDKIAFYNLETKKYITDFIYDESTSYNIDTLLENNYLVGYQIDEEYNVEAHIINKNDGSTHKILKEVGSIQEASLGDKIIYLTTPLGSSHSYKIYNSNFESFTKTNDMYYYAINTDNTISLYEPNNNNIFYIYDQEGNLKKTSKEYQEVVKLVKDYIIILDEEQNLKLLDLAEEEKTTYLKVTDEYRLHPLISGWYTENGKNGIYMVIENKNIPYGTEGSGLEYYYIPETEETGLIKTIGVGGYAKPVLYLYPTKKTNITISFEKPYLLTTTYPKFKTLWNVTAYPNGDLYDQNNKYYYGLYWEEIGSSDIDFVEGFYVTKENAIDFLEEKTQEIGFTRREANEFIMYWLPILEKNEKNLVYFELTEERNKYNQIKINPEPDSLLRVAIHVKKVDKYTKIKEQKLIPFIRNGFVAVEWGGVEH